MSGLRLFGLGDLDITTGGSSANIGGMTSIGVSEITGIGNDSITINSGTSIFFDTNNNPRIVIDRFGNLGIGESSPARKFHFNTGGYNENPIIWENCNASDGNATSLLNNYANNTAILGPVQASTDLIFYWKDSAGTKRAFSTIGTRTIFTGQHSSYSGNSDIKTDVNLDNYVGLIVKATGKHYTDDTDNSIGAITINNAWPVFSLCNSNNDKSVYGVITNRANENTLGDDNEDTGFYNGLGGKIRINSLGEGAIWVCNKNGNIDNGDYITSCTVPGYGNKQSDDLLHNYTVAKSTTNCTFSLTKVVKRKIKLVDDPTGKVISFDSQGNPEYEDILDPDGNIQMVYPLETRFLQADGTLLTDEADYQTRLANGETVYIACFVGCTYHCG